MPQSGHEALALPTPLRQEKSLLHRAFDDPINTLTRWKGLALLSVLSLAGTMTVLTLAVNAGPGIQSREVSTSNSMTGQARPGDWALSEGGFYGSSVILDAREVQEWAWAEGRYYWSPASDSPAGKGHGH